MKKIHSLFILLMIISLCNSLYSQEELVEGRLYKNAKILTKSGNTVIANFIYKNDSINIFLKNSAMEYHEGMQRISRIEIKSYPEGQEYFNNVLVSTGAGILIGLAPAYIVYKLGYPEYAQYLAVGCSGFIGFVIGVTKKTYKPIYISNNSVLNKINFNIYYNTTLQNLNLNLTYNF